MIPGSFNELVKNWSFLYSVNPHVREMLDERVKKIVVPFIIDCRYPLNQWVYSTAAKIGDEDGQGLFKLVNQIATRLQVFGEAIPYGLKREALTCGDDFEPYQWSSFVLLDSDKVEVECNFFDWDSMIRPKLYVRPDSSLLEMQNIPKEIMDSIKKNISVPLDLKFSSIVLRKSSAYDLRGTPPYKWVEAFKYETEGPRDLTQFQFLDDPESEEYKKSIQTDRLLLEDWMINKFFRSVGEWNGLSEIPKIIWKE